jgi:hypothetical protein
MHRPLCPQETDPVAIVQEGWVGLGADLDGCRKFRPHKGSHRLSPNESLRPLRYPAATTLSAVLQQEKQHKFRHTAVPNIL